MPTEVENALELRLALKKFMPDLGKETQNEMANALRPVVARARGFIPADAQLLSGWVKETASIDTSNYRAFPTFNSSDAKRGLGYRVTPSKPNKSGYVSLARVQQTNAGGAIYETAGRLNRDGRTQGTSKDSSKSLNPNAGKQFIDNLNGTGKFCLLYTSPSPRDGLLSRMPSSA